MDNFRVADFFFYSEKGTIVNQVTSNKASRATETFVIESQTGDISLYDKVVGD